MVRGVLASLLLGSVVASATTEKSNQDLIERKLESIESRRGIDIGGSIRSVYQGSSFESDQDLDAINAMPDVERSEFVVVDIDLLMRPWESVRVNAMLRLEAGMQNYFASPAKSLSVPWINAEGNVGSRFYWVVGDFRQAYTPLTLFAPGVDILYEPMIFARDRQMAQNQALLQGNQRNLQGFHMQYRHDLQGAIGELRLEALGARLRRVGVLDLSGANGNLLPSDSLPGSSQAGNMDKYLAALNLEWLPLQKNLFVGATQLWIQDDAKTYTTTQRDLGDGYVTDNINPFDTLEQKTAVTSGRVGADVAGILGQKDLIANLTAELALSTDEVQDSEELSGQALLATFNVGYAKEGLFRAVLGGNYLMNDSGWFNNVAQSPQFFARRINNSDKDGQTIKYGVHSPLYSSFDALYNFVPKFTPVSQNLKTDQMKGTSSYDVAPFNKSSWSSNVLTRSEIALLNSMSDPALQLALPNGLATSNRKGLTSDFTIGFKEFAEVKAVFNTITQNQEVNGLPVAEFTEYGAGAKVDVFKAIGFSLPLELSGSYKHSGRTQGDAELNSDFINAGLYVRYHPRLGVSGGFQQINTELNVLAADPAYVAAPGYEVPMVKGSQYQWMVGLDYTLAPNAWFSLNYGQISVENTYQSAEGLALGSNLPNYAVLTDDQASYTHSFTQSLIEASINVDF